MVHLISQRDVVDASSLFLATCGVYCELYACGLRRRNFLECRRKFAIDDIVYKTSPAIPEPGTLLLVRSGIGGLQLAVGS